MMAVIAIIGALMGVMVVNLGNTADEANVEATKATMAQVESAVKMYKLSKKKYPSSDEGLQMLLETNKPGDDAFGRLGQPHQLPVPRNGQQAI